MRKVLFVVRTATTLVRLLDIGRSLFSDIRVQVVFTIADGRSAFATNLEDRIRASGGVFIPWDQACATEFDLAISLSSNGPLHLIHAPLLLLSHGPGRTKTLGTEAGAGSYWHSLLKRREYPLVIGLTSMEEVAVFSEEARAAASTSSNVRFEVVGDVVLDELHDTMMVREHLRRKMGVNGKKLITLSSSWSDVAAFPADPQLATRLLASLPADEYAVTSILHPNIWVGHGEWQVRTWLADAIDAGLILVPFEASWQTATVMADRFMGDHGSVTLYAQLLGIPTRRIASPTKQMRMRFPLVREMAKAPLVTSLAEALCFCSSPEERLMSSEEAERLQRLFVANVGSSRDALRELAYSLMRLEPPESTPRCQVPSLPPRGREVSTWRVVLRIHEGRLIATRHPGASDGYATDGERLGDGSPVFSALVAKLEEQDFRLLQTCDIALVDHTCLASGRWQRICPNAAFAAFVGDRRHLSLHDRLGNRWMMECVGNESSPYVLAALGAYAALSQMSEVDFSWHRSTSTAELRKD